MRTQSVHPRSKLLIGTAATLTLAQIAASMSMQPGFALTAVSDLTSALLLIALVFACADNAVFGHGRLRSLWILLVACWSLWLADQCGWIVYDVALRKPLPNMFPGDVLLFLAGVPVLAALLLRPHIEPSRRSARLGILDFLQLMLWWIYCYAWLVTTWEYISPNAEVYNRNFDRLYLVQFAALVVCLALLVKQSAGRWRVFYICFLGAVFFSYFTVILENRAIEAGSYHNGSWYDVIFVASLSSYMAMIIQGRKLIPVPEAAVDGRFSYWMSALSASALLSLPAVTVESVYDRSVPAHVVRFRVLLSSVTMLGMTVLALVKQRRMHEDLKDSNRSLEEASMTDPLTGIRNRRFFSTTIDGDIAQSLRSFVTGNSRPSRDIVFYLIDIDNFKEINDQFGHDAGDQLLVETARRINSVVRSSDVFLRWGGEEFLIVSRFTHRETAGLLAQRVLDAFRNEPFAVGPSQVVRRTCSIGWAAFPWLEDDVGALGYEDVLRLADRALIQAKRAGKNQAFGAAPPATGAPSAAVFRGVSAPNADS